MDIQILTPQAGQDYPTNWNQFLDWFGSEEACLRYLEKLRWPLGFACPSCGELGDAYTAAAEADWSAGVAPSRPR